MAKIHKGFNLLRDQLQEADKWDKIQNWVNGTARVIVIVVEFLVIICFGTRIFMDRVARNLDESLENNKKTLDSLKDTELRLRQLQFDLQNYKGLWDSAGQYSETVKEIYSFVPTISNAITLSIDNGGVSLSGNASKLNIGKLEGIIKSSPNYNETLLISYIPQDGEATDNTLGDFQLKTTINNFKRNLFVNREKEETPNLEASPTLVSSITPAASVGISSTPTVEVSPDVSPEISPEVSLVPSPSDIQM